MIKQAVCAISVLGIFLAASGWASPAAAAKPQLSDLTCDAGQTIMFDGVDWVCADFPSSGVTGLVRIQQNSDPADDAIATKQVIATCPAGKKVLGGGHGLSLSLPGGATNVPLRVSAPTTTLNGWLVTGTNSASTPWGLTAFAVCADAE